jgi:hypothetical protein
MNGEGIMSLPGGGPTAIPGEGLGSLSSLVEAQNITKQIGKSSVLKNLLDAGADLNPFEVQEFIQEIQEAGLSEEDMATIRMVVERVEAGYRDYPKVRSELLAEGAPEDLLPEQFDPEFFIALDIASQVPIGAPAPVSMMDQMDVQGFAQGGLASLPMMNPVAQKIASMGRNGDSMLAHITPQEAMMLRREGGSGTINPYTGLPEFFKKAFKKIGNAVKKFAESTVGRAVIGVAAGMILGPAAIGFVQGATGVALSAAATTAITFGTGSFVSGMAAGDGFKNSLKAGVMAGAVAYGGSALFSGGASMATPAAGTGPQSFGEGLSQGLRKTKDAVTNALGLKDPTIQPSAAEMDRLQQEPAIRQQSVGTGDAMSLLQSPGGIPVGFEGGVPIDNVVNAPLRQPLSAANLNVPPYEAVPTLKDAQQQAQAIQQARAASATGAAPSTSLGSPGMLDRAKAFYTNPSLDAFSDIFIDPNAKTLLGKYGPLLGTGALAMSATGGFKAPPTDETPLDFDPVTGLRPGERPYEEQRPDLFGKDVRLPPPDFSLTDALVPSPRLGNTMVSSPFYEMKPVSQAPVSQAPIYKAPSFTFMPQGIPQPYNVSGLYGIPSIYRAKKGSSPQGVTNFPRKTGPINGPGTGTSDSIPAMLSDGEFVFTAKAVRNIGNGSRRKGAARMYKMMKMLEGGPINKG